MENLSIGFGGLTVIDGVGFEVPTGGRVAPIGPNGAGKTRIFNLRAGVYRQDEGHVRLAGEVIDDVPSRRRIGLGMACSFQNIRLMPHLSVVENVMLGRRSRADRPSRLPAPLSILERSRARDEVVDLLSSIGLGTWPGREVATPPYGVRKTIELARARAARPKLLLLDEPAAGLSGTETAELRDFLLRISETGVTLLVVEHGMGRVRSLCTHAVALNFDRKIHVGPTSEVQKDPLEVEALSVAYGCTRACREVSSTVNAGEIVTVLGANGAGRTSLPRALQGAQKPSGGSIRLAGEEPAGKRPAARVARVARGMAPAPEGRRIFVLMTVEETLPMGAYLRHADPRPALASICDRFPDLAALRDMKASALSGGEQQMLAVGRALLSKPRFIMLDEPSLGFSPLFVEHLFSLIREINAGGVAILLVERDARMALEVAARR